VNTTSGLPIFQPALPANREPAADLSGRLPRAPPSTMQRWYRFSFLERLRSFSNLPYAGSAWPGRHRSIEDFFFNRFCPGACVLVKSAATSARSRPVYGKATHLLKKMGATSFENVTTPDTAARSAPASPESISAPPTNAVKTRRTRKC